MHKLPNDTTQLLVGQQLLNLVRSGFIDAPEENVNASSIDVRIDRYIRLEDFTGSHPGVKLGDPLPSGLFQTHWVDEIPIPPGEFFLANTMETLNLPDNISAEFKLRSSVARSGIEHLMAGWIDAGFNGQLTLELKNAFKRHAILIPEGFRIGQITFWRHRTVEPEFSYRNKGRYNGQKGPTTAKAN